MGIKLVKYAKLPNRTLNRLIRYFVLEVPSSRAARELGVNRHSADRMYTLVRKCLVHACEAEAPPGRGVHEVDESYFGGRRKGNRGRGAAGKSDSFRSYDGLITSGYRHYRINHDRRFAHGKRRHINGIENFWGFAKTKLRRYYGIPRNHFFLYLKEMEFRFNHRHENLLLPLRKIVTKYQNLLD